MQVRLVPYNPDYLDESVLWTESGDTGNGFRCIRMVNNIGLNFDAFHGDKDHGGVREGTTIVLWEWLKGLNQQWKIVPYCEYLRTYTYLFLRVAKARLLVAKEHSNAENPITKLRKFRKKSILNDTNISQTRFPFLRRNRVKMNVA